MLRGTYEHSVDDKGRVNVPARFREQLQAAGDNRVVITNFKFHEVRCLHLYPLADWVELEDKLRAKPQFDQHLMNFIHYYVSAAHECEIDKQGRILLPAGLREYAGLKRDVLFTSVIRKLHIWDRKEWYRVRDEAERAIFESPEGMEHLKRLEI